MDRLSPAWLFSDLHAGTSSPLYLLLGIGFLLLLLLGLQTYIAAEQRAAQSHAPARQPLHLLLSLGFAGLGLSFTIFASLATPFLSKRIWLIAATVGLLATGLHRFWQSVNKSSREPGPPAAVDPADGTP